MDLIKSLGELAIGSRLKRLSDQIMKDGHRIYLANGIDFQPKWFPVFYALSQKEQMSVTEIASALDFAHPSVSQSVKELEKNGLAISKPCPHDARKREISLSKSGLDLLVEMEPLWRDISNAIHRILVQNQNSLLRAIEELEGQFEDREFFEWVQAETKERQLKEIEIVEYSKNLKGFFGDLNYEWIKKYFEVEDVDREVLDNPQEYVIQNGGKIIFARLHGKIVGTCALMKLQDGIYEMAKMAVAEKAQGKQVGRKLGLEIIKRAQQLGARNLVLESNKKLVPALKLYESLGFQELASDPDESIYCRANVKMQLVLHND